MFWCGVVVAGLLLTGCTSTVTGHGTPPVAGPISAGVTPAGSTPAGAGSGLPHSPCDVLGEVPDLTTLLGAGWYTSEQDDYCRISAVHGGGLVVLHHNRFVSLEVARADSAGTPRGVTVAHRPVFYKLDSDRVVVTVSRFADPGRAGVLECTVQLGGQGGVGEFGLAVELLTRVMPRYVG